MRKLILTFMMVVLLVIVVNGCKRNPGTPRGPFTAPDESSDEIMEGPPLDGS
ncbi:MAG: hypothetical protein JRI47_08710 [Deltaproteobacteria bacterium]|nr:hypothetical protein [Deltaproteobacteria bacterium]